MLVLYLFVLVAVVAACFDLVVCLDFAAACRFCFVVGFVVFLLFAVVLFILFF